MFECRDEAFVRSLTFIACEREGKDVTSQSYKVSVHTAQPPVRTSEPPKTSGDVGISSVDVIQRNDNTLKARKAIVEIIHLTLTPCSFFPRTETDVEIIWKELSDKAEKKFCIIPFPFRLIDVSTAH